MALPVEPGGDAPHPEASKSLPRSEMAAATSPATACHRRATREGPALLARIVERDVVPRLVLARTPARTDLSTPPSSDVAPHPRDAEFARLVLADAALSVARIAAMHARGANMEALYLDLLAPAARHLRHLWTDDLCDLASVTIGLCRLQLLVRWFSPAFQGETRTRPRDCSALIIPPDRQPAPEMVIAEEFFRRAGWRVGTMPQGTGAQIADLVVGEQHDVACFGSRSWIGSALWPRPSARSVGHPAIRRSGYSCSARRSRGARTWSGASARMRRPWTGGTPPSRPSACSAC